MAHLFSFCFFYQEIQGLVLSSQGPEGFFSAGSSRAGFSVQLLAHTATVNTPTGSSEAM